MNLKNKRYTIKLQDDFFGVVDNISADKVCIVNGIRTKIEAVWLCDEMNQLNDEKELWKHISFGNATTVVEVMNYLKENHPSVWKEVNKEVFNE